MSSITETICNENVLRIQIPDTLPICECKSLTFTSCLDCQAFVINTFQSTQTKHGLLKSQKEDLQTEQKQGDKEIQRLEQTILERQQTIEKTTGNIKSMRHDLKVLKTKYEDEMVQVEEIQESKETVKKELEELNQKLFEEAERMVQTERREQDVIRQGNSDLERKLKETDDQLEATSEQLKRLKGQIKSKVGRAYKTDAYCRAQLETMITYGIELGCQLETADDGVVLVDFSDFIQLASQTPLRKLHSLKYMKYCIREDIEPCLRFGPNPRLASKKIVDAILVKTCFVEECPEGFVEEQMVRQLKEEATATLWERFTSNSVFSGCQACGRRVKKEERKKVLKYRFRISYFDEWACVDRYCRDRLLAAIEFYSLIRHIRAGFYKHRSLHELDQQATRLRLQMFLARMGALPYLLSSCHMDTQKIGTAFHGQEYPLPCMYSTNERLSSSTDSTITSISTASSFASH